MKKMMNRGCLFVLFAGIFFCSIPLFGATRTWTGNTSTNWNTGSNWDTGVPGSGDNAIIPSGTTYSPIAHRNVTIQQLTVSGSLTIALDSGGAKNFNVQNTFTINSGGTVTLQPDNSGDNLRVYGNWVINSGGTFSQQGGDVVFRGTSTLYGTFNFTNVVINSSIVSLDSTADVSITYNMRIRNGATLNNGPGILRVASWSENNGTYNHDTGTLQIIGSMSLPSGVSGGYYNLQIGAGGEGINVTISEATSIFGSLVINTSNTLSNGSGFTITMDGVGGVGSTWENYGSYSGISDIVQFIDGNSTNHLIYGTTTFETVYFGDGSAAGATRLATGAELTFYTTMNIRANYSLYNSPGGGDDATLIFASTCSLSNAGTFYPETGTIKWQRTANIPGSSASISYYNLIVDCAGTAGVGGAVLNVANDLTISTGATLNNSGNYTIKVGGQWLNYGTFVPNTCTVVFTGPSSTLATNETFYNLTAGEGADSDNVYVSGGKLITVSNTFIINNTTSFYAGSNSTLTLSGLTINSGAVFYEQTSNVTWNGVTLTDTDSVSYDYYNLTINTTTTTSSTIMVKNDLNINGSSSLTTNNNPLKIGGNFVNANSLNMGAGQLTFNGTSDQAISGAGTETVQDILVDKTGTLNINKDITISGTGSLTIADGELNIGSNTLSVAGTVTVGDGVSPQGKLSLMGNPILEVGTGIVVDTDGYLHTSGTTPKITSTDEITPTRYSCTINGTVDINALDIYYLDANGITVNIADGSSSTITAFTGTTFYNTASATSYCIRVIVSTNTLTETFNTLTFDSGNGVADKNVYFSAPVSSGSVLTIEAAQGDRKGDTYETEVNADSVINWPSQKVWVGGTGDWHTGANWSPSGVPDSATSVAIPSGNPTISTQDAVVKNIDLQLGSTLTLSGTKQLTIYGTWTRTGTFSFDATTTINFAGNGTQTIPGGDYPNIIISGAGTANPIGTTIVTSNFQINSGSTFNGVNYTLNVGGDWVNLGTFNPGNSIVKLSGTSTQNLNYNGPFWDLQISNTSLTGVAIGTNIDIQNDFNIDNGSKVSLGSGAIAIYGDMTLGGSSAVVDGQLSTVTFDGVTNQTITVNGGSVTFNNVIFSSTGTLAIAGNSTIDANGYLTIASGCDLDMTNDTLYVGGAWTATGSTTYSGSTVVFDGTADQNISSTTFNNVTVNKASGAVNPTGDLTVAILTISAGTFNTGSSFTHSFSNFIIVSSGTFNLDASTIIIGTGTVAGAITVASSGTLNLNESGIIKMWGAVASSPSITINGTITSSYTTTMPKIQSYNPVAGPFYGFTVNNGGTIFLNGLSFDSANTNGMVIEAGASITDLDYVNFQNMESSALRALHIKLTSGTYNFTGCSFDATCTKNCRTETGSIQINFYEYGGDNGGSSFEDQAGGTQINWIADRYWIGGDDTRWDRRNNWLPRRVPTASNAVYIESGKANYPRLNAAGVAKIVTIRNGGSLSLDISNNDLTISEDMIIESGGTLTLDAFSGSHLFVGGNWNNSGTLNQTASGGNIYLQGSGKYVYSESNFRNIIIDDGADYSIVDSGTMTVISGGTFKIGDTTTATFHMGAGTTLTTPSIVLFSGSTWDEGTGTVVWTGSGMPSNVTTFYNLTIDSATASLGTNIVVLNDLTINSSAVLDAGNFNIQIGGDFANNGTFTYNSPGTQTVTFNGSGTQSVTSSVNELSFNNLTINLGSTLSLDSLVNSRITVVGNATNNGTLKLNANTFEINGTFTAGGSSALTYGTGVFYMNGTSQNVPYTDFYDLKFGGAVTYKLSGTTTIYNNLDITGSSVLDSSPDGGTNVYNITMKGNWTQSGSGAFTERTSTVTFSGTAAQQVTNASDSQFYNMQVSNTGGGSTTLASAVSFGNNLTVTSGTLDLGLGLTHNQTGVSGTVSVTGGVLDLNTGRLNIAGNCATSGTGKINLTDSNSILDIEGNMSNSGTLDATGSTALIYCAGDWTDSGAFNIGSTTVTLDGSSGNLTTPGSDDFYSLVIGSGANETTQSNIHVTNTLTNNGTFTLYTGSTYSHTVDGAIDNNATLAIGTSTLVANTGLDNNNASAILSFTTGRLQLRGTLTFGSGTFTESNGTVEFDDTSVNQTIPTETYFNIEVDKGGKIATAGGDITSAGTVTVTTGTLALDDGATARTHTLANITNGSTLTLSASGTAVGVSGNVTNNGTLNINAGTITLSGGASTFDNNSTLLIASASSQLQLAGNLDNTGGVINFNNASGSLTIGKTFTNGGSVIAPNGTILFNTANSTTIPSDLTYYKIEIDKSTATATAGGALSMQSEFKLTTGTFDPSTYTHIVSGNWVEAGGTFNPISGKVKFDGTSPAITTKAGNYFYNLEFANSGTATVSSALDINGTLTVGSGSIVDLDGGYTHDCAGVGSVTGTVNLGTSVLVEHSNLTINAGGVLNLEDSSVLRLGNGVALTVDGTLNSSYTSTKPSLTSTNPGTDRYAFTVSATGTLYLKGLALTSPDSNGLTVNDGATITDIDEVDFTSAPTAGTFLRILSSSGTYYFNSNSFDTSFSPGGYNVYLPVTSTASIGMVDSTGVGQGATYENDPGGNVNWTASRVWDAGNNSTDWSDPVNWSPDGVPGSSDDVIVNSGFSYYPVLTTASACRGLMVNTGASLNLNGYTLSVGGDVSIAGTFTHSNGKLTLNGVVNQAVSMGGNSLYDLEVNKASGSATVSADLTLANNITITAGELDISSYLVTVNGSITNSGTLKFGTGTLSIAGNCNSGSGTIDFNSSTGTLKLAGTFSFGTLNAANGTIEFNGSTAQTIPTGTYYNLVVNKSVVGEAAQTLLAGGALTINGDVNIQDGKIDPSSYSHIVGGNWTEAAGSLFYPTAGTIQFTGAGVTIDVEGGNNFYNLTINSSGLITIASSDSISVTGSLSITSGTLNLNNGVAHSVTSGVSVSSGAKLDVYSSTVSVGGDVSNSGTVDLDTNTASLTVSGGLTNTASGTIDFGVSSTAQLTVGGNWSNSGTINVGNSSVTLNSGSNSTVTAAGSSDFYNLTINKSAGIYVQFLSDVDIDGNLTLTQGDLKGSGVRTIYLAGNWSVSSGTFTNSGFTVIFNGNGGETISSEDFAAVQVSSTGNGVTALGNLTMTSLTVNSSGKFNLGTSLSHTVGGAVTVNGTLDVGTSSIIISGALTCSGAGATIDMDQSGSSLTCDSFTNQSSGTLTFGTSSTGTLTSNGDWNNSASISVGNSTITIDTSTTASITTTGSSDFYNLVIGGSVSAATSIDIDNNLTVNNSATFDLGSSSLSHIVGGNITSNGTLNIDGSTLTCGKNGATLIFSSSGGLTMGDSSSLVLPNNAVVQVNGRITTTATSEVVEPEITSSTPGTARYDFSINGTVDINGLDFTSANVNGMQINSGATVTTLDDIDFSQVPANASSRHLWFRLTSGTYSSNGSTFDRSFSVDGLTSPGYNVVTDDGTTVTISFDNYSGLGGGPTYESEGSGSTITWVSNKVWTGEGGDANWDNANNWNPGGVPDAGSNLTIPDIATSPAGPYDPIVNTNAVCYSVVVQNGGNLTLSNASATLDVSGNFSIQSGGTVNITANTSLYCGGVWTDSGTMNQTSGTVILDGNPGSLVSGSFNSLQINGDISFSSGNTVTISGTSSQFVVANGATFRLKDTSILKFGNATTATINSSGTLRVTSSGGVPEITSTGGGNYFDFNINGTAYISGLKFSYGDTEGLYFNAGSTIDKLINVTFTNATSGGRHLTVSTTSTVPPITCSGCYFDTSFGTGSGYNVYATDTDGGNDVALIFDGDPATNGAGAGESYDFESGTASVNWYLGKSNVVLENTEVGSYQSDETTPTGVQGFAAPLWDYDTWNIVGYYLLVRVNGGADKLVAYDSSGNEKSYSPLTLSASYGDVIGPPYPDTVGTGPSRKFEIFFNTDAGYFVEVQDTGSALVEVYAGQPSDAASGTSAVLFDGTNVYFAGANSGGTNKVYGLKVADKSIVNGFPFAITAPAYSLPSFEEVTVGQTTKKYLHFATDYDVGSSRAYIFRLQVDSGVVYTEYSGAQKPGGDIKGGTALGWNNDLYVGCDDGYIYGVDVLSASYTNLSNFPFNNASAIKSGIWYNGNVIYYGDDAGVFHGVNVNTGSETFTKQIEAGVKIRSYPLIYYPDGYVGNDNGKVYKVDLTNQSNPLTLQADLGPGISVRSISYGAGQIIVGTADGKIYFIDP